MYPKSIVFIVVLLIAMLTGPSQAQQGGSRGAELTGETASIPAEQSSVTEHTIVLDGETIPYIATAATMHLVNDGGEPTGSLYYTAYTLSLIHI